LSREWFQAFVHSSKCLQCQTHVSIAKLHTQTRNLLKICTLACWVLWMKFVYFMVFRSYGKLAQHGLSNDIKGYQDGTQPYFLKNKGYLWLTIDIFCTNKYLP